MTYQVHTHKSIHSIDRTQWQLLAKNAGPFVQYDYLLALENSSCVNGDTGWHSTHITLSKNNTLVAIVPGYVKHHSYGEYVFDHSWANAYHQHGLNYYPKWISAIPFTPVTGPRILSQTPLDEEQLAFLIDGIDQYAHEQQWSSAHWLFAPQAQSGQLASQKYATRLSVQFEWHNRNYTTFDDFTGELTSRKRRSMRKARNSVVAKGVTVEKLYGDALSEQDILFFYQCYTMTYLKRSGHTGYLNKAFFLQLYESMADNILLVKATCDDTPIACALFFYDDTGLYGRYWGALQEVSELHFECCYYQGIEFAIAKQLPKFNPGTQGEHKILRGFEPTYCYSAHRMFDENFHQAVAHFLHQETPTIRNYFNQAKDVLPFNQHYLDTYINNLKTENKNEV